MSLSIVVGTYNRLDQIQRCIASIGRETKTPHKIYITDAGSTDGTIEYLNSVRSETIIPVLVGEKLGQAKAYNDVFDIVATDYVCWLSDDNEVVDNGLDLAVEILRADATIGMVGLKTKDVQGPFVGTPFIGGVSPAGILNVNQGMLPTHLLKKLGGFSTEFRDYGIDNALTADVLFSGHKVVYTSKVALHHYRNWSEDPQSENYQWIQSRHETAKQLYAKLYVEHPALKPTRSSRMKQKASAMVKKLALRFLDRNVIKSSSTVRTAFVLFSSRYISLADPILSAGKTYHLVQSMNKNTLKRHPLKHGTGDVAVLPSAQKTSDL